MKTMSKEEWNDIKIGKLDNDMTIEDFKSKFEISNDEFESARKSSMSNEYNTIDLFFFDEDGDRLTAELNPENNMITHLYV